MTYIIRRIRTNEYGKLCDLIQKSYGDSYVYKYMYNQRMIEKLNACNRLISFVAVTTDDQIVGHVALKINHNQGELLAALTKKEYRGQHILHEISREIIEYARELGLEAVYVMSIMSHDYSQKAATRLGLCDSAIVLSCMHPMQYKGIIEKTARESLKISYLFLDRPDQLPLYIPDSLLEIVKLIYNNMHISIMPIEELKKSPLSKSSVFKINYTQTNICFITIEEYGEDLYQKLDPIIDCYNHAHCNSIYLLINMENANTPNFYNQFIERGFFFGGVKPGCDRNQLILQNVQSYDPGQLKINTLMGKNLLKYILEHRKKGLIKEKNYEYL